METIKTEFNKCSKDFMFESCINNVDLMIKQLEEAKDIIKENQNGNDYIVKNTFAMKKLEKQTNSWSSQMNNAEKIIHHSMNKYNKTIDKAFVDNSTIFFNSKSFPEGPSETIDKIVVTHLVRDGKFEIALKFIQEMKENHLIDISLDNMEKLKFEFNDLYLILDALHNENLNPAILWANEHEKELEKLGSNLQLLLHKFKFIELFLKSLPTPTFDDKKAVKKAKDYASKYFAPLAKTHFKTVSQYMNAFAYRRDFKNSPYASLFDKKYLLSSIERTFCDDYCAVYHTSAITPLYSATSAGSISLPILLKSSNIMKSKRTEWTTSVELPVETPLPKSYYFHPIFVCPVSKEQTTQLNPPMMLPCGHILAKVSLEKITHNTHSHKFKCPYCPIETTSAHAVEVTFV